MKESVECLDCRLNFVWDEANVGGGGMVIQGRNFMTNKICVDKIRTLDIA